MFDLKPIRILYMDDDHGLARLFQKNLQREGYEVDIAPDGKTGLGLYESGGYDIVAVDQAMPGMTGLDVLKVIACRDGHPPMIMVTGTGNEEIAVESLKLGAADYIIKDVDGYYLKLIPALIRKILQKQQILEERRQALNALSVSEEKFSKAFHFNPNPMTIVRFKDGTYLDVNESTLIYSGYALQDMIGRTPAELGLFTREDMKNIYDLLQEKGVVHDHEYTVRTKTGEQETGLLSAIIIDLAGEPCVLTTTNVITARKRAEEALKASEQLKASILDTVPHAIFVLKGREIFYANKGVQMVFGWSPGELVGRSTRVLYPRDEDYERVGRDIYPVLEAQRSFSEEVVCRHKLGHDVPCQVYTSVIGERFGDEGIVALFEDITQRKRMREEFLKAQKLESIGTLAGGIAHDFNNILTGIMGNVGLAKMKASQGEKLYTRLDNAEKACSQAKELAERLITFAKGGQPRLKISEVCGLLKKTVESCVKDEKYHVVMALPDDLWDVELDEIQMRQCMENILINAMEAMPQGGPIHVSAENIPDASAIMNTMKGKLITPDEVASRKYVRWSIADTGRGIPHEHLQRIFDPYFSTKPFGSTKGLGLGLSICYSIIDKHNGLIAVESEPGKGAQFSVYLPAGKK